MEESIMFKKLVLCGLFIMSLSVGTSSFANEPENLSLARQTVINYHDSGEYQKDVVAALQDAKNYLAQRIADNANKKQKLAIVLDIDDTALNEYDFWFKHDFMWHSQAMWTEFNTTKFPAIKPTLELYNYAKNNGVAIFFITGRYEKSRQSTIDALQNAGYKDWNVLYMRPDGDKRLALDYKVATRKQIQNSGFDIVLSVSDQASDLQGGFADHTVKVPNPFYIIP